MDQPGARAIHTLPALIQQSRIAALLFHMKLQDPLSVKRAKVADTLQTSILLNPLKH